MHLREEIKTFDFQSQMTLRPSTGSLAINGLQDDGPYAGHWSQFQSCREVFQLYFKLEHTSLWFAVPRSELPGIADFMTWVEMSLAIPNRSNIYRSTNEDIAFVEVSSWWRDCEMKKNVLTLFLRAARCYANLPPEKRSHKNALMSYPYSRNTMTALSRFLLGFTRYTGPPPAKATPASGLISQGWNSTFYNKKLVDIRPLLVSP